MNPKQIGLVFLVGGVLVALVLAGGFSRCEKSDCKNGYCDEATGSCICSHCFTGEKCQSKVVPKFVEGDKSFVFSLNGLREGSIVTSVHAGYNCGDSDCNCDFPTYTFNEGNDEGLFGLNPDGSIILLKPDQIIRGKVYPLSITASNQHGKDTASIHMRASDDEIIDSQFMSDSYVPHSRKRRAVISPPSNVTFVLEKIGEFANVQDIRVGASVRFSLTISFPATSTDMSIELFTPDNETTIMNLCNPIIKSIGSKLTSSLGNITELNSKIQMDARPGIDWPHDRAIIHVGTVSHATGNAEALEHAIVIEFEAVTLENPEMVLDHVYWVSAGAEYNNEDEIWIGQWSFTAKTDNKTTGTIPTFNLNGAATLPIGTSAVYTLDMILKDDSTKLIIDAVAPLNTSDVMSVCGITMADSGLNYNYIPKNAYQYKNFFGSSVCNPRSRLDMNTVTNRGKYDSRNLIEDNHRLSVAVIMSMADNETLIGQDFWIGVAVQLGTDKIWAGQIAVKSVAKPAITTTVQPTVSMITITGQTTEIDSVVLFEITIDIGLNTEADYEIEVLAPFNDTARMSICNMEVSYTGMNVPCVSHSRPQLTSKLNDSRMDRGILRLGRIKNFAFLPNNQSGANLVKVQITATVPEDPLNVVGAALLTTFGVSVGADRLWVGQSTTTIGAANTSASMNDSAIAPTITLRYAHGTDRMPVGSLADVRFEFTTKPNARYAPMQIEMMTPVVDNKPVFSICSAEVLFGGKNLPCFNRIKANESITYHTKTGDNSSYDRVAVALGTVCNIPVKTGNTTEDQIVIRLVVKVEDHPSVTANGTKHWISAGVRYTDKVLWVGQVALFILKDTLLDIPTTKKPLLFYKALENDTSGVPLGVGRGVNLIVKLPPETTTNYKLTVTSASDIIGLCNLRIVEVGNNLRCYNFTKDVANYTEHPGLFTYQTAEIDLLVISNPGGDRVHPDDTFDNTTMIVEVIYQVDLKATQNTNYVISADLEYGKSNIKETKQYSVTAGQVETIATTNATRPDFSCTPAPLLDNGNMTANGEVNKGQAFRLWLEITANQPSQDSLNITILSPDTPTPDIDIAALNLVKVGKNFPCLRKQDKVAKITSRPGSTTNDIASLYIGPICRWQIYTEPDEDKLRVEVIGRLRNSSALNTGDKFDVSVLANINSDQVWVGKWSLTVIDSFTPVASPSGNASVVFNMSETAKKVGIGERFIVPVLVQVPVNSTSKVLLDIEVPANKTAVMDIEKVEVVSSGENLACLYNDVYYPTFNSTLSNTQTDRAFLEMGIVTNTGTTYRVGDAKLEDDQFLLEISLWMMDSWINTQGSTHWVSVGVKLDQFIVVADKKITVERNNNERPKYDLTTSTDTSKVYDKLSKVVVDAQLNHNNESTAEGYNVSVLIFIPPFMKFDALVSATTSPSQQNTSLYFLSFKWDMLLFTDSVNFTFEISLRSDEILPGNALSANVTIPTECGSYMIDRAAHSEGSGVWFPSGMQSIGIQVTGMDLKSKGCDKPLGIQNGGINDCQIKATKSAYAGKLPTDVRMDTGRNTGWTGFVRSSAFREYNYVEIYFGNSTIVSQISLRNLKPLNRISSVKFDYSNDGDGWSAGEVLTLPTVNDNTGQVDLQKPRESRYIRIKVWSTQSPGKDYEFQIELYGCVMSTDVPDDANLCTSKQAAIPDSNPDYYERGFIGTATNMFYCDANPLKKLRMQCFATSDGSKFHGLEPSVINVIGFDPVTKEIYGIAVNKRAYLISKDNGLTWRSIPPSKWMESQNTVGLARAMNVDWKELTAGNQPEAALKVANKWGANYNGMYVTKDGGSTWIQVSNWNTCCT